MSNYPLIASALQISYALWFQIIILILSIILPSVLFRQELLYYRTQSNKYNQSAQYWSISIIVSLTLSVIAGQIFTLLLGVPCLSFDGLVGTLDGFPISPETIAFLLATVFIILYYYGRCTLSQKLRLFSVSCLLLCSVSYTITSVLIYQIFIVKYIFTGMLNMFIESIGNSYNQKY